MPKTVAEITSDLKKRISFSNPKIDLTSGNVATDLGVDAFADELAECYTETDRIRLLYMYDSTVFTENEADLLANSFSVYRLSSTNATGEVVFCATALPADGSQFTIPIGTTVTTSGDDSSVKSFVTTTEGVIDSSTPLNPATNYYEVIVNVQASSPGSTSNVGPGAINQISTNINGVSVVYNQNAIVNGKDRETKESLIQRTKLKLAGYVYGTKSSLLAKALEDPRVSDALLVDPDSEFSVRGPGSIDIYILGSQVDSYSQTVTEKTSSVYLTKTPAIENGTSMVTFDDGTTVTEGHGYNIVKDESSIYSSSSKAMDKIVWDSSYFNQVVLTKNWYSITYPYNKLISDIQTTFDNENTRIITSDILIRDTQQLDVSMDFDIVTLPGYDNSTVRNNVVFAIQSYINNFKLDEGLRQSDIIGIVEGVDGVDYVKLPMRQFNLKGVDGVSDVDSSPLEYIRVDSADILIG